MDTTVFCIVIYAAFSLILLWGIRPSSYNGSDDLFHSLNSLRGIFALGIVIGHCVRYESGPLTLFGHFMLLGVGYFFFISGYGIMRSYSIKPGYMNSFLKHRVLNLIITALTALVITTLVAYISPVMTNYRNIPHSLPVILRCVQVRTNWYMRELLMLYLFFYIGYRYCKKYSFLILNILTVFGLTILYILEYRYAPGYTRCWYASIICFPFGMLAYMKHDRISAFLDIFKGRSIIILIMLIGLLGSVPDYASIFGISFQFSELIIALFNNMLCVGFIFMIWMILKKLRPGNPVMKFLTGISAELYLYQFIFLAIAESMGLSYPARIIFVLSADIILSLPVSKVTALLKR